MARYSSMRPRHFARLFRAQIGVCTAKAVERMRRGCLRVLGNPPAALKRRHSA